MLTFRSLLVLAVLAFGVPALGAEPEVRVVDGDSLVVAGERIRLQGIDAPEMAQTCERGGAAWRCGKWSARVLENAIAGVSVTCRAIETDRYGRTVATCRAGNVDLARHMVQAGAARAYTRYSDRYVADEVRAKAAKVGLWEGRMVTPEVFRHPVAPVQVAGNGCDIKGNVSAKGVRIFHAPGQRDYAKTKISRAKGEAYFCSAAEARAAGFRAAKR